MAVRLGTLMLGMAAGVLLLTLTGSVYAGALPPSPVAHVPEMDPGSMAGALTLLTAGFLLVADRRRR